MSRKLSRLLLAGVVVLVMALPAAADLKIVQKTHTGGIMGQPAQEQVQVIYASSRWIRQEMGDKMAILFDNDSGKMYILNLPQKEYSIMDAEKIKSLMSMAAGMMGEIKAQVSDTGRTAKVGKWNTKVWTMNLSSNMFTMDMDIYATPEIEMPAVYTKFQKEYSSLLGPMQKMVEEMEKIKGYPVKSSGKMTIMGQSVDTITEVVEVSTSPIPKSIFEIPKNFKEVEFNIMSLQGMQ